MFRVNVYIDGFNLYHAIDDLGDDSLKWLDLYKLSEHILNKYQTLHDVKYFSAYATWRPDSYKRHRDYVAALQQSGVQIIMGRFKEKQLVCKASCKELFVTHEEKETDVNIGAHLVADALQDKFDTAYIISADTDLAAVVRLAQNLVGTDKRICTVAPPKRFARARELQHLFEITKGKIRQCQLPDKIIVGEKIIYRPEKYR
jgi:uncharacterized LabA/DUF88 family protein